MLNQSLRAYSFSDFCPTLIVYLILLAYLLLMICPSLRAYSILLVYSIVESKEIRSLTYKIRSHELTRSISHLNSLSLKNWFQGDCTSWERGLLTDKCILPSRRLSNKYWARNRLYLVLWSKICNKFSKHNILCHEASW